jgi:hypothetical protein
MLQRLVASRDGREAVALYQEFARASLARVVEAVDRGLGL